MIAPEADPSSVAEPSGLAGLYEREWGALVRIAYVLTSSRPVAEEIAQDAFLRLQASTTHVVNPPAYLRTTVVNACRSFHRHRAVVERTPLPRPEPVTAGYDELFDALGRLSWRQQAALVLRFHLDLPEAEIAVALGCRPSTVRSLTRRALTSLRKELS